MFLQSFADKMCSGKSTCTIRVHELIPNFKPCPIELSSYMETSFICQSGNSSEPAEMLWICKAFNSVHVHFGVVFIRYKETKITFRIHCYLIHPCSITDKKCSGLPSCEIQVFSIPYLNNVNPCPMELSSFLEISHTCVHGSFLLDSWSVNLQSLQITIKKLISIKLNDRFFPSYADMKCSGRPNCHIDVMLLIKHSKAMSPGAFLIPRSQFYVYQW